MSADEYRRALKAAIAEYEKLLADRERVNRRLAELQETISSLMRLCGYTPTVPWGLTEACRAVLLRAEDPMTPVAIRDRLRAIGFDLTRYANELAAIHTTLKRLEAAGQVKGVKHPAGGRAYAAVRVRVLRREDLAELLEGQALAQQIPPLFFDLPPRKGSRS
jgi:hypothetical protein